jgi:hypothetical protein
MKQLRKLWKGALFLVVAPMMGSTSAARAVAITSDAPGNIFVTGRALQFHIREMRGDVALQLREYSGRVV